jgi:hypothetical protein
VGSRCPRIHGHHSRRLETSLFLVGQVTAASQQSDAGALAVRSALSGPRHRGLALGYGSTAARDG